MGIFIDMIRQLRTEEGQKYIEKRLNVRRDSDRR